MRGPHPAHDVTHLVKGTLGDKETIGNVETHCLNRLVVTLGSTIRDLGHLLLLVHGRHRLRTAPEERNIGCLHRAHLSPTHCQQPFSETT